MDIIDRIGRQLKTIFPEAVVYRKNQKGGFKEPSFFVSSITTTRTPEMFNRQKRSYHYQLIYFPDPDSAEQDMERMQENLLDRFTELTGFSYVRDVDFSIVDGALTMTFAINVRAYPEDLTPKQRTLDYHGRVIHGKQV